jgi:hypothetical protein
MIEATKLDVRLVQPYCANVSKMFVEIANYLSFTHYTDCIQLKQSRSLSQAYLSRPTLDKLEHSIQRLFRQAKDCSVVKGIKGAAFGTSLAHDTIFSLTCSLSFFYSAFNATLGAKFQFKKSHTDKLFHRIIFNFFF